MGGAMLGPLLYRPTYTSSSTSKMLTSLSPVVNKSQSKVLQRTQRGLLEQTQHPLVELHVHSQEATWIDSGPFKGILGDIFGHKLGCFFN